MNRALGLLLGEIPVSHKWDHNALKLMDALLQDSGIINSLLLDDPDMGWRALGLCFCLLEDNLGAEANDRAQVRSRTIASLIRVFPLIWKNDWYTPAQFDSLVDYHLRICGGTDSEAIRDTFMALEWLNGSPSPDRIRNYLDMTIRFMGHEITCHAALLAACAIPTAIASVGQDDVSFREDFLTALALAIMSDAPLRGPHNNYPFRDTSGFNHRRYRAYLKLLGILSQEPTWQPQLKQNNHLDNCLAIANTVSSEGDYLFGEMAVRVTQLFAIIDPSREDRLIRRLIAAAWRYIFSFSFFGGVQKDHLMILSTTDCLKALPILAQYSRRRCNGGEDSLIALVEQVCQQLFQGSELDEQGDAQHIQDDNSFSHQGIPTLGQQIREILVSRREV